MTEITAQPPPSKKRVVTTPRQPPPKTFSERVLDSELEITGILSLICFAAYYAGSPVARKALFLSYQAGPDAYNKGWDDVYFVAFWVVAFTFLRAVIMKFFYHPLGLLTGIKPFSKRQRFAEQGFMFTIYTVSWITGMYIIYNSPYWLNTSQFWIDYPHILLPRLTKYYYLMQISFWFQQLYTIQMEKPRKDHLAMVSHHFITITLLITSYYSNFTRIGNAVLCCMDLADILLSFAKMLRYLQLTTLCDIAFAAFALAWPITRHGFFTCIIWATAFEPPKYMNMVWEPEKGRYFTPTTQKIYLGLFVVLDVIMIYWFSMIVRVVVRVIRGQNAEDTRSDDEDEDENEHPVDSKKKN
ncbi:TLC domain-domain-containing protein [Syncephalastrum racemosum]|uniref:TLC domain-domain-containing protein n=1 Tax=Syncephalastrum racemosum TaxID=13706 RepID=A0A1X2H985_SYNRA|nr:TLC domain-domain-containing protein [Syncephalastrum racemosum]